MSEIDLKSVWMRIVVSLRRLRINKYVVVLVVFAVLFLFVGQQSILRSIGRAHQIRETEHQIELIRQENMQAEHNIAILSATDSLEQYAREHYYMHTSDEDIYIVPED